MKKFIFISAAIAVSVLSSCDDEDRLETDTLNEGPKIVGFVDTVENIAYFSNVGAVEYEFPVKYLGLGDGSLSSTDIALSYEVDPSSTAVLGQEFSFAGGASSGTITIPAGQNFANIPLTVNTGSFNPIEKTELILKLSSSSSGVIVGEQYKKLKIIFVGCETNLEATYRNSSNTRQSVVTKVSPNVYRGTWFPNFSSYYWFEFSDVCGELQILDWQFQGGNPISATGGGMPFGFVTDEGDLTFEHVNVAGVSWYVDLTWTLFKL